jgi:hypothetical protein
MSITLSIGPIVALVAGILILIVPRLLSYIIALYLIIIGVVGLFGGPLSTVSAGAYDAPPASVQHSEPGRAGPVIGI